ncbi:hypothetical protein TNCV_4496101 [Trichonephila clavipes]|nr:hypothetical protein TNCV_4496101 [Trichonephila clavipes]
MMVDGVHKDEKERGLTTEPCGTPAHILQDSESAPLNLTENVLPLRKSFIYNNALPLIPVPWIISKVLDHAAKITSGPGALPGFILAMAASSSSIKNGIERFAAALICEAKDCSLSSRVCGEEREQSVSSSEVNFPQFAFRKFQDLLLWMVPSTLWFIEVIIGK